MSVKVFECKEQTVMFALNITNQEFILYSKYVFVEYSNVRIYKYTCLTNIKIIHELLKNIRAKLQAVLSVKKTLDTNPKLK